MTADVPPTSPRWGAATKFLVSLVFIFLVGALVVRFQSLITPLALAFMIAYLLNPVAEWAAARTRLGWGAAVNVVYGVIAVLLIGGLTAAGIALVQQAVAVYQTVVETLPELPARFQSLLTHPILLGPFTVDLTRPFSLGPFAIDLSVIDLQPLYNRLLETVQPVISQTGSIVGSAASSTAEAVGWLFFILIISYYLLHSLKDMLPKLEQIALPAGYAYDLRRLVAALGPLWDAFLRGQVTLALVMGVVVGSVMSVVGVRYAVWLGVLSGLLEFIPILGPILAGTVAVLVALFQPVNWFGLPPFYFALLVLGLQILLQQLENNFLVPRIIGGSLNLHPVLIMVGAIVGANLAGIVGLLLSAPLMATLRLFGRYCYFKLFDLDPWPQTPPPLQSPRPPSALTRWATAAWRWLTARRRRG